MASRTSQTKLVVAAIDFGTTYSGYAYSFRDEIERDPLKVYANTSWNADGEGLVTLKAPTTVLFEPNGTFHSFGFEAEGKYAELTEEEEHEGWRYFRRFKMELHKRERITRTMKVIDDQGRRMEAKVVFGSAIKYLKNHLLFQIRKRVPEILEEDINFVLTVPAIWSENSKEFMIEAAKFAEIPSEQLNLALEPEAAALFCKNITFQKNKEGQCDRNHLKTFEPHSQFMVIDMGGGTIDITVHEVTDEESLSEIIPPDGGPWGGILVDSEFLSFLEEMFTKDVLSSFKEESRSDYFDLFRLFEFKKRNFKLGSTSKRQCFKLPSNLYEIFDTQSGTTFAEILNDRKFKGFVEKKKGKLFIDGKVLLKMFENPKEKLITHLRTALKRQELRKVNTLLVVGGFSESDIMTSAIKKEFPEKTIIIPEEAGLAVVKGAVIFGFKPNTISSRKLPFSIGVATSVPFQPGHPELHRSFVNGELRCEDVFRVIACRGKEIIPNRTVFNHIFNSLDGQGTIEIYQSTSSDPQFTTDDDSRELGKLKLRGSNGISKLNVSFIFDTKLKVIVSELGNDRNMTECEFDCLH